MKTKKGIYDHRCCVVVPPCRYRDTARWDLTHTIKERHASLRRQHKSFTKKTKAKKDKLRFRAKSEIPKPFCTEVTVVYGALVVPCKKSRLGQHSTRRTVPHGIIQTFQGRSIPGLSDVAHIVWWKSYNLHGLRTVAHIS